MIRSCRQKPIWKAILSVFLAFFVLSAGCGLDLSTPETGENMPGEQVLMAETAERPKTEREKEQIPATRQDPSEKERGEWEMVLQINDTPVAVTWENNETVRELMEQVSMNEISIEMSRYGGWEQVGSLGRGYPRDDKTVTAICGDIMLYNGNQIVVFYGANNWSYTRLGKMDLSDEAVKNMLSQGDVSLKLTMETGA